MLAYKGFNIGYVCRGYQFDKEKVNRTDRAKCVRDGFHAALNPLDCFSYYPDPSHSVYCLVECSGDIHEDCSDTKIACTELRIVKELSMSEMMIHAIAYMEKHKEERGHSRISKNKGTARNGFALVFGGNPIANGSMGDVLAFAQTSRNGKIVGINVMTVGKDGIKPHVDYNIKGDIADAYL